MRDDETHVSEEEIAMMNIEKYTETVVEMTSVFWQMVAKKEIDVPEDSRDIWKTIDQMAKEYEEKHEDTDWDDVNAEDYYDSIEEFCYFKFSKYFGTKDHGVERLDTIGSLIDTVEDFLTEKGIASETEAFIQGRDYDYLADQFAMILKEGNLNE